MREMPPSDHENNKAINKLSEALLENRIISERMEGKLDRIRDRMIATDKRVEALLDIVTGSKTGVKTGLIVRVHDLEKQQEQTNKRIDDILAMNKKIGSMEDKLDKVIEMQTDHPTLLYSLRFNTRKTLMWLLFALMIVSLWFVSGLRQPILEFFGLPIF
jgi:uncharacterized coiled-coil protein SlyX